MTSTVKVDIIQPYSLSEVTINELASNSVNITGGSVTGITDLAVADGGTGASTASGALTNLGVSAFAQTILDDAAASDVRTTLGLGTMAVESKTITTRGDLIRGGASGVLERVALGTNGQVLTSNGTDIVWGSVSSSLPRSYLAGCILSNNVSDTTNDIDITAGACRDSTNAVNITVAAMTKRLDAGWSAGTGNGMRNSAAAITDTTYHIYAVSKADGTQDIYAHTSATVATVITALQAESGGADYLYARRLGSIVRAGATILGFVQDGDDFQLKTVVNDISTTNPGTSAVSATLASIPTGIRIKARANLNIRDTTPDNITAYVSDLSVTDMAPTTSATAPGGTIGSPGTGPFGWQVVEAYTNTSAQIRYRVSASSANTNIWFETLGWIDSRGRND